MGRSDSLTTDYDGGEVRRRRHALGLSIAGAALEAGVSTSTWNNVEAGKPVTPRMLGRISQALDRLDPRPPPAGPAAGGVAVATAGELAELRDLVAELSRRTFELSSTEQRDEWSDGLLRAAFGGDVAQIRRQPGTRRPARRSVSSFHPDESR